MGSQNTQMSAVLAVGAIVAAVGERERYLQNGAVERIASLIVAGQMRHDGLLYTLGELCEDVCHVLILRGVSAYRARTQTPLINPDWHAIVVHKVADHPCMDRFCNELSLFVPSLSRSIK